MTKMTRTYIKNAGEKIGEEILINGWVDVRRDQGKMVFFDFRDMTGTIQGVVLPGSAAMEAAKEAREEFVVSVRGKINERPEKNRQKGRLNGDIELEIFSLEILNPSLPLPFDIRSDTREINEDVRLKYRYLDLRSPRMQKNMRRRDAIISFFRKHMHEHGFVEIETPIMMKGTPEGSREYVIPSRLHKGQFYVLPQSPQQFKQLLMVSGFEKYFQIARCMRDEDQRGDRQPEFTQLDFEMSFVMRDDVLSYTEDMFIKLVKTLYPDKKISETPFPRLTYRESMEKYGTDKPDLRKDKNDRDELAFAWIVDFPMFEKKEDGEIQAAHHPFCAVKPEDKKKFMDGEDIFSIRADSYDLVLNGFELSSGSIRIHDREEQKHVFKLLGISEKEQAERFGHLLEAFTYGAPPHGGFAPGIDRIAMILENEPNIREVIAFPKTGEGRDLMAGAPAEISEKQLKELGISITAPKKSETKKKKRPV